MKAFVTGATGFIGRRLVERMVEQGLEVVALVRSQRHGLPPEVQAVPGDVLEPGSLGEAGRQCRRLYHLAALITFDPGKRGELLRVNGQGTKNLLEAARRWKVERFVLASSAITCGLSRTPDQILDENSLPEKGLAEVNPYLASKMAAEKAALAATDLETIVVRPTTVYGPGDWTFNSGTLVRRIARSGIVPVPPGGSNVVDVDDVVEGILSAGERGRPGGRYLLGSENLSFARIFSTIAEVVGRRPLFFPLPRWLRRPGAWAAGIAGRIAGSRLVTPQIVGDMFAYKYYSSRRAQQEFGWVPRFSFRESVERAWAFYRQQGLV